MLVVAASMLIALLTYSGGSVDYLATCSFRESLPPSTLGNSPQNLDFQQRAAQDDVNTIVRGDIFSSVAGSAGAPAGAVSQHYALSQAGDTGVFTLAYSDGDRSRAISVANGLCSQFVSQLGDMHTKARDTEVTSLRNQIGDLTKSIASLQATPKEQISQADLVYLEAQKKAIATDQQLLAQTLAMPMTNVEVLTKAATALKRDQRNLGRNLVVAGIGALLACFLIILVGEIARDSRVRARAPEPPVPALRD
jgi:uncharacterized protein involved in exopolysaccharide biosynthesis